MKTGLELFARSGINSVTVDELAEAAGYSRGAVYSNFESKIDLALSIMEDRIDERAHHLAQRMAIDDDWWRPPPDQPQPDPWDLLFIELWVEAARSDEVRIRLAAQLDTLNAALAEGLAGHDIDPPHLAPITLALMNGMSMQYQLTQDEALFAAYEAAMRKLLA